MRWNVAVAEFAHGYSITLAPLAVKDKVIIGVGGGEYGIRGFIAAYDAATGKEAWRFNTIPAPGEPGSDTWSGDAWKNGGGSLWVTGTYDPSLNLTYWGIGNPGPDFNPRSGQATTSTRIPSSRSTPTPASCNGISSSRPTIATTGTATQVPVLVDTDVERSAPAKLLMLANRNGFFYVLDRTTGKFLFGKPFVKVNWASGLDANGRPMQTPQPRAQRRGRDSREERVGTRRRTARAPVSSTFRPGRMSGGVFTSQPAQYQPGQNYWGGNYRATRPAP